MQLFEATRSFAAGAIESTLERTLPYHALESYNNPRLEGDQSAFLDDEHIRELVANGEIQRIEKIADKEYIEGAGWLERYGFITKLGYAYSAVIGTPEAVNSDTVMLDTTAWGTSDRGHNEHTLRTFLKEGNFFILVGAEGSWHEETDPSGPITLADSAAAVLSFSNYAELHLNRHGKLIQPRERYLIGESRGAMVGMGTIALAEHFNQHIIAADLTAPCVPIKLTLSEAVKLIGQLVTEPTEICKLPRKLAYRTLRHYPSTVDPSHTSLAHQFAIGFALFSGEAGALAKHVKHNTFMHVTTFEKDLASMEGLWRDIFEPNEYPDVRITSLPGSHLTIADPETLMYLLIRRSLVNREMALEKPLRPGAVFDEAHEVVTMLQDCAKAKKIGKLALAA